MGTIYEIICWTTGLRYIGQTTQILKTRLIEHKSYYKNKNNRFISASLVLEHGNYEIYELEVVEDESKLNERELYYIQHTDCVNIRDSSYNHNDYMKKYNEKNKEKISEKRKEKVTCDCGSIVTKAGKSQHLKSNIHQNWLANNP